MNKIIKLGLDFDGVLAYNPFRLARYPIAYFKQHILGIKRLSFFYPKNSWQKYLWILVHESSVFPAKGAAILRHLVERKKVEAHLITARFNFLDNHLYRWLEKYQMRDLFKSININKKDQQPHIFKSEMLERLKLDFYIEDNLDIVKYLNSKSRSLGKTEIYWIYNLIDRNYPYKNKFPYLQKALEKIKTTLGR